MDMCYTQDVEVSLVSRESINQSEVCLRLFCVTTNGGT
jgi:hypothetical protein